MSVPVHSSACGPVMSSKAVQGWGAVRALSRRASQRGFGAVMLLFLVVGIGAAAAMFSFSRTNTLPLENDRKTADALAEAKAALIGYALQRGAAACSVETVEYDGTVNHRRIVANLDKCEQEGLDRRPGELPCPDTTGDGIEDMPCNTAGRLIGRLPWKTIGMPEPRDGSGEALWYTLSGPFRGYASNPEPDGSKDRRRINSDTRGNITVLAANGATVLTDNAVFIVFAPHALTGAQNRNTAATAVCAFVGALPVARSLCFTNYLESVTTLAAPVAPNVHRGPFISVTANRRSSTSNDQLIYVTTAEFIPLLEMRVGAEIKSVLQGYRANSYCECYPWADTWPWSGGIADSGQNRGRFATAPVPHFWGETTAKGKVPELPPWIEANDWHNLVWYSVARAATDIHGVCRTCSDNQFLLVDGNPMSALFFMPGTPLDGLARTPPWPPGNTTARRDNLAHYLRETENINGANDTDCPDTDETGESTSTTLRKGKTLCDTYVTPVSKAFDRNRLFTIP